MMPPLGTPARVSPTTTPSTPVALKDEEEFNQAAATQLTNTRKTAENWKTGLAGLLTLVTTVLFIKGKSAIEDFTPGWRIVVGLLLLFALSLAVWATWLSLRAAFGTPKLVRASDIAASGGLTGWRLQQTESAIADMNLGRVLALVAAGLVALVLALSWWTPKSPPAFVSLTKGKETFCGELRRFDNGTVKLRLDPEHDKTFSVAQVSSLKVVNSCEA
jgi:hypothetical protein